MKQTLIAILILMLFCNISFAQQWHSYNDTLKPPINGSHFQISVGFFNRMDTVECIYKLKDNSNVFKGYKLVYILDGYYVDTQNTFDVFFDDKKQRIFSVKDYSFN